MSASEVNVRRIGEADYEAVCAIIDRDRLPGQPLCTLDMLHQALLGDAFVDRPLWEEMTRLTTIVAEISGTLVGGASYAREATSGDGHILWIHAQEAPRAVNALIDAMKKELGESLCKAFQFSTPLTAGLEALPIGYRPITHQCLLAAGFESLDLWSYFRLARIPPSSGALNGLRAVRDEATNVTTLTLGSNEEKNGYVSVGMVGQQVGLIWYLHVSEAYRGRGYGRQLVSGGIDLLLSNGASEIILYVDDDEPDGPRTRVAAKRLYKSVGFEEVDRLYSYERRQQ